MRHILGLALAAALSTAPAPVVGDTDTFITVTAKSGVSFKKAAGDAVRLARILRHGISFDYGGFYLTVVPEDTPETVRKRWDDHVQYLPSIRPQNFRD